MAHDEWHLTMEEFSAYLDGELSSSEQDRFTQHLRSCSSCQEELHELRQTLALLKALPQPALPRSFTLSLDFARLPDTPPLYAPDDEEVPLRTHDSLTTLSRRSTTRGVFRVLSAIAAVIGLFLLGSGLLSLMPSSSFQAASQSSGTSNTYSQDRTTTSRNNDMTPSYARTPQITSHPEHTQPVQEQAPFHWPILWFLDLNTDAGRLGLGLILFLLGAICWLVLRAGAHT